MIIVWEYGTDGPAGALGLGSAWNAALVVSAEASVPSGGAVRGVVYTVGVKAGGTYSAGAQAGKVYSPGAAEGVVH